MSYIEKSAEQKAIREKMRAIRAQEESDLAKYAAIQKQMQERERVNKEQEAFELGALSERRKQAPAVDRSGLYGATIADKLFGTGGPIGAATQHLGGDIPSWLVDGVIGAGNAISSGMGAASDFLMDAVELTPEERKRDAALGEQLRRNIQQEGVWSLSEADKGIEEIAPYKRSPFYN